MEKNEQPKDRPETGTALRRLRDALIGLTMVSVAGFYVLTVFGMPLDAWVPNVGLFVGAYYSILLVHEFGHVVTGVLCGSRLKSIQPVAFGVSVALRREDGQERTNSDQFMISIGGPLLSGFVSSALLLNSIGHLAPLILAAAIGLGDSVANVLIPYRLLDGGKMYRALAAIIKGSADDPFVPKAKKQRRRRTGHAGATGDSDKDAHPGENGAR